LPEFIAQYPGTRAAGWWQRERGIDMLDAGLLGDAEKQLAYLREHNLLTRGEREGLGLSAPRSVRKPKS
jgi:hypothetical protein